MVFSDLNRALAHPQEVSLSEGEPLYGLPILWSVVQDSYQSGPELASSDALRVALEAVGEILAQPYSR
jgi:hypothetical protein